MLCNVHLLILFPHHGMRWDGITKMANNGLKARINYWVLVLPPYKATYIYHGMMPSRPGGPIIM